MVGQLVFYNTKMSLVNGSVTKELIMQAWNVYVRTESCHCKLFDTVFFNKDCDKDYVRDSLINHDNYPTNIVIRKAK